MTDVQQECIRRIAEAKSLPQEAVALDTSLASIDLDSLDRVSLSFDIEEQYGIEIPQAKLTELRTVADVADAVQEALERQASAAHDLPAGQG